MYPISANFSSNVTKSHRMSTYLEIYQGIGYPRLWQSDDLLLPGSLLDGEVSVESGNGVRRRLTCRFIDPNGTLTPDDATDLFTPYGHEIRAYRGIYLDDGTVENIPLGVFGISSVEVSDGGAGVQLQIEAYDRAKRCSDAKLIQDYAITQGTKYTLAIQNLLLTQVPQLLFNFVDLPYTTPSIVVKTGEDPWAVAQEMATSIGCELYFDVLGVCTLRVVPNYNVIDVSWTYAEGSNATILSTNKRLSNSGAFNYYIFTGEASSTNVGPVRGDAYDDNPMSATYYKGPYGLRPAPVVSSKLVTSSAQAVAAAVGALQSSIGFAERVHFNAVVNAAHEVGDVVQITRLASKINNKYVLDQLSVPLTHNRALDAVTRFRQAVA